MRKKLIIVMDGPAGAGKSTVSQILAQKLKYTYLDSGALYRCIAYEALRRKIPPRNSMALYQMAKGCKIYFKKTNSAQQVYLNGQNVTSVIRTPTMSQWASQYSALPKVRLALLWQQRKLASKGGIVGEGRDMGTVVFPKADVKFFLKASLEERSHRRFLELKEKGMKLKKGHVAAEIQARDRQDTKRKTAPLKRAKDAIEVDTTHLGIDEVVGALYKKIQEKQSK
ncbi:MAG: (d)CMP kinase [Deltaproteobacteria bacterium]|nr:(d)CMP kinase [Deltaproteobacteria bacterium]